jgi:hypothetical protein
MKDLKIRLDILYIILLLLILILYGFFSYESELSLNVFLFRHKLQIIEIKDDISPVRSKI